MACDGPFSSLATAWHGAWKPCQVRGTSVTPAALSSVVLVYMCIVERVIGMAANVPSMV